LAGKKENIIIDPGFGFAKNAQQNLKLLNEFWKLNRMGYPILSGLSRKRLLVKLNGALQINAVEV
jgi:dihydropteroate synthase